MEFMYQLDRTKFLIIALSQNLCFSEDCSVDGYQPPFLHVQKLNVIYHT